MSWLDQIQTDFTITTGDNKTYSLLWINATKLVEYNIAEFDFPQLGGTLISRGTPRGARYNVELFFQGEDHLDKAKAFEASAANPKAWIIAHPLYGRIICQPLSLLRDNIAMNVTKILCPIVETITQENPITTIDAKENLPIQKEVLDDNLANSLNKPLSSGDIATATNGINANYSAIKGLSIISEESEAYYNLFKKANSDMLNVTSAPLQAMRSVQSFINYPSLFTASVQSRVGLLTEQFATLRLSLPKITKVASKQQYQIFAGSTISAQAIAAATPLPGNYTNRTSVFFIINILISNYNQYLIDLDGMQSANGGNTTSFIPDATSQIALNDLINLTISNLFDIALNSKQERTLLLSKDTNIVELTHRLYSLDPNDDNINELMTNNNWSVDQLLQIKKGTKVTYYI